MHRRNVDENLKPVVNLHKEAKKSAIARGIRQQFNVVGLPSS